MVGLGDSFLLRKPGQDTEHLWVLITKPDPVTGEAIMVNITSLRSHSDTTTILYPIDHTFISRPSVVYYSDIKVVDPSRVDNAITLGFGSLHTPFSTTVLRNIQAGVCTSPMTPGKIKIAFAAAKTAGLV